MAEDKKVVAAEKPARELQRKESPFDEIEHMFDDFLSRRFLMPSLFPRLKRPDLAEVATSIDMFEEGNDLVVKAELPGIKKEDLNVDLKDNYITISGEKKSEERTDRVDFHRVERSFGSFVRRLRLPTEIKADKVKASFSDGVLEIRMPKSETVKPNVRKIKVN